MRGQTSTKGEQATIDLGVQIGSRLKGGEILVLESDLGGGKTALARGIAVGIGSSDSVSSPTFTVSHVYSGNKLTMHHYDFYRLGELGIMSDELHEVLDEPGCVIVIEWPQAALESLPKHRIVHIKIDKDSKNEDMRIYSINTPDSLNYVMDKVAL